MEWVLIGIVLLIWAGLSKQGKPLEKTKLKDIPKALMAGAEVFKETGKKFEQASASLLIKTTQHLNQRNIKQNLPVDALNQFLGRADLPVKDRAYVIGIDLLNQQDSLPQSTLEQKHEALLTYVSSLTEETFATDSTLKTKLLRVLTLIPTDEQVTKMLDMAQRHDVGQELRATKLAEAMAKLEAARAKREAREKPESAPLKEVSTLKQPSEMTHTTEIGNVVDYGNATALPENFIIPDEIVNFLHIRYYLTGLLSFPNVLCVNDVLQSMLQTQPPVITWGMLLQRYTFDESKRKDIRAPFHFTHIDNLDNICKYGLLTRSHLNEFQVAHIYNDQLRLDGIPNSVSLSVGFPNCRMFYHLWSKSSKSKDDWVVLKISPNLLTGEAPYLRDFDYLNKAIFCCANAASSHIKHIPINDRKSHTMFLSMFEHLEGCNPNYPCDEQAEILYLSNIPTEFIEGIYVFSAKTKKYCQTKTNIPVYIDTRLFTYRNVGLRYG